MTRDKDAPPRFGSLREQAKIDAENDLSDLKRRLVWIGVVLGCIALWGRVAAGVAGWW